MPPRPMLLLLLLAMACHGATIVRATETETSTTSTNTVNATTARREPEPLWGRIYLRRGLAPIQYFRDGFGGPMVAREVEFVFPRRDADRLGCELLPADEQDALRASNGSAVLVVDRGVCTFETKARLAQQMGAAALVVVSVDESAKAPVAIVHKGEIAIASVMVRKSAGDMLRVAAARERVFGRLVPIVCERGPPLACKPLTDAETQYVERETARSGVVVARASNATLGDFLAATYGSVLPSVPLVVPRDVAPIDGCGDIDSERVAGKVALFSAAASGCSVLAKVSSAQRAGAVAALLAVGELPVAMKRPGVEQSWHAYNITIAAAAISSATLDKLVAHQANADGKDAEIYLELHNRIADAWDQVRRLSVKTAWPTRKDRQEKLLRRVVGEFELDESQLLELKHHYLTIAGGSGTTWEQALAPMISEAPANDENVSDMRPSEVAVDASGATTN